MKALCFLGTGKYEVTTYVWKEGSDERSYETHLFPEAVARIFRPEKIFVLVTPQAREHENFKTLCERLGDLVERLDIPEGKSEPEIWAIFQKCTEAVTEGDTILLDVTHAFRSLPLLIFAVAGYLRRTKSVTIQRIVYGAYDARDEHNRSPVLDLTPLMDLLDWLSGAEALLRRSDAEIMGEKLDQTHRRLYKIQATEELPLHLQKVANSLQKLSKALYLCCPLDVMRIANYLLPQLDKAVTEAEKWAKPFGVILSQVRSEVAALAHHQPEVLDADNLRKQLALIDHYLSKGLTIQAVTLAREWVVSWAIGQRGQGDWLDEDLRKEVEYALGAMAAVRQGKQDRVPDWAAGLPRAEQVSSLWTQLAHLRNTLAHCWMRKDSPSVKTIEDKAREIPGWLRGLLEEASANTLWSGRVVINLETLYEDVAKMDELPLYLERAKKLAGEGNEVVLTGQGPIWLYLAVAHALHGKARKLFYTSPTTGEILIFDHAAR
ncbi:MAG: TIGR02221 family CRISPR-associated protein [Moorellaceae bacterium]